MIGLLSGEPWHVVVAALLAGAALVIAVAHARLSWTLAIAVLASVAAFALNASLNAPRGGADAIAWFAMPLIAVVALLCGVAGGGVLKEIDARAAPYTSALALCVVAGWCAALFATDWIGLAAAVEMAWLASAGLVASSAVVRGALNGAARMVAYGGASATLMLTGAAFVARAASSVEIAATINASEPMLGLVGMVLMLLSLAMKAGLAPLHAWAGAAFGRGASFAVLFLGGAGLIGAVAVIVRVAAVAAAAPDLAAGFEAVLAALGAASIVIGSIQAMGAADLRRLAGYAFASQAGCILLSVSLGSPAGFAAALVQMVALAAAMLTLLLAPAATRDASMQALDGLARRHPLAAVAVTASALSLMGAPLTIGFLGRWRLIEAAVGAGWWWAAGIALLASLAAVFYGGRLIERIYFRRAAAVTQAQRDSWRILMAPALLALIAAIGWGVEPSFLLQASGRAASHLFGAAP